MPIYEYQCNDCGEVTDVLARLISQPPEQVLCKTCGSGNVNKKLSTFRYEVQFPAPSDGIDLD
jgi:putative FmdB family regulatory protein